MLTIVDYKVRESEDGDSFIALIVQGGVEMVKSKTTGKFYATARKASVPSTFRETVAETLIGSEIDGTIKKVDCEPYEYTIQETNEIIQLSHRYEYVSVEDDVPFEDSVVEQIKADVNVFSANESPVNV